MDIHQHHLPKLLVVAAAATSLAIGAASAASATTEPPTDTASTGTEAAPPSGGSAPADAAAFCEAELAVEAAFGSEDEAAIGPAVEALVAATPEEIAPTVQEVLALASAQNTDGPEFAEAYSALVDYMKANCGFTELNVALSDYAFGGIPAEVPAGGAILTAENIGEEVHEIFVLRVNDDVTLSAEEIAALPEEELFSMVTFVGGVSPFPPGETSAAPLNLTPGRHIALCFIPQGTTPEVFEQMMAAEGSVPPGSAPVASGPTETDHAEMTADTAAADSAAAETAPAESATGTAPADGSAPAGSAPAGEGGTPHRMLGMFQEFTVV